MSKHSNAVRKSEAEINNAPETTAVTGTETTSPAPVTEAVVNQVQSQFDGKTAEDLIKEYGNKSNAIRAMSAAGLKAGPISKALGIRYQHARNVMAQPLKRVIKAERDGKAAAAATEAATTA